jgi:tRNA threonylcarbamoyladenosine biosynthesis protein TsaB
MNLLAFDTSTDNLSIAVQRGEGESMQIWHHTGPGGAQASTALIPAIQQLMAQAGLPFDQLHAIAFGRGPGSFTGLRTACSVAQGLAFGAGVPVLPVYTLVAVAEEARFKAVELGALVAKSRFNVLALLDARMDEVYAAHYEFNSELFNIHGDYKLIRPENLVLEPFWQVGSLVAGNALAVYGERLAIGAASYIHALPTASAMLRLAPALLAAGQAVSADQALPTYIRDKVARTTQERLADKAVALA